MQFCRTLRPLLAFLLLAAQQVTSQDLDKILERADGLLEEAKAAYEKARSSSSVASFVDAGFKLEEARIKYLVLQEIGQGDKQKIASDRLRAVNQLSKLIHDGKVAITGRPADGPAPPKADPAPAPPPAAAPKTVVDVKARAPVPDAAKQRESEKQIRDLFKDQYAKKGTADRAALARTLMDQAAQVGEDRNALWVLYREAHDVASSAGDIRLALEAADGMANFFDVDALALRSAAVGATAKSAKAPPEFAALTAVLLQLVDQYVALDQYDAAEKSATLAAQYARRANDSALAARAAARAKDAPEAKAKFASMKKSLETLAKNPADGAANLDMGQFLCLTKGSWDLGLRFLAKGSDPTLKALAEKELAGPTDAADQAAVGDGWWDLAEKEKSPARKEKLQAHAQLWYGSALPGATGLLRLRIEKRVGEAGGREEPSPTGLVGRWSFNEGSGATAADTSGKNNHGTLTNVQWGPGLVGGAIRFEGEGWVTCGVAEMPAPNAPHTLTWALQVASNCGHAVIFCLDDQAAKTAWSPGIKDGRIGVWKWAESWLVSTQAPPPGEWRSYAYTFDGKTHRLYVDGVLKDSSTAPPHTAPPKRLVFGRWAGGMPWQFLGGLDEVRIYARALGEPEVQMLGKPRGK
jgi:hypothetical protein